MAPVENWARSIRRALPPLQGEWKIPNRLNHLSPQDWMKFQKSWFIHNPPPRKKNVALHPAKFPETLVREFIEFFTVPGEVVLDPMLGTGSTLIAAMDASRSGVGIELAGKYYDIAKERIDEAAEVADEGEGSWLNYSIFNTDARDILLLATGKVHYCITSPPYWDMLRAKGAETQAGRREAGLDVHYSDDDRDVGNIEDYEAFVEQLVGIYRPVAALLAPGRHMTVIVKNVKKGGRMYPLAWDLGREIGRFLTLKDEKIWCQDNQKLGPYGMGNSWVSNTFHHYCLTFKRDQ